MELSLALVALVANHGVLIVRSRGRHGPPPLTKPARSSREPRPCIGPEGMGARDRTPTPNPKELTVSNEPFRSALADYFDVVALGRTPTSADLEDTLEAALAGAAIDSGIDRDELRRDLTEATKAVMVHARDGHTGQARTVAASELARLTANRTPARTTDHGDLKSVVASIPRI